MNAIEKVKHQLRINFDLRTEQMMALSTVASNIESGIHPEKHSIPDLDAKIFYL